MTEPPGIPQDIIDTIIDILHSDSTLDESSRALKACSLAGHTFLHPCRKHLFASITLTAQGTPYKWDPEPTGPGVDVLGARFHHLLTHAPHLAPYVRSVEALARNGLEKQWLMISEEWAEILTSLTRIERLAMGSKVAMRWTECSGALRSALISLVSTTPLKKLSLYTLVGLPVALVEQFGALERIQLLDSVLGKTNGGGGGNIGGGTNGYHVAPEGKLRAISARGSDLVLEFLLRPNGVKRSFVDYRQFSFLDIQLGRHPGTYLLMSEFLSQTVALVELHCLLSAHVDVPLFEEFLKHHRLPRLKRLSFHVEPFLLPHIYTFLNTLPADTTLDTLDVLCSLYGAQDQGLSEILKWGSISLHLPLRHLRIRFFLEQNHAGGEDHDWADSIFSSSLRPHVRENLLTLIEQERAKIYLHVIHYFGSRHFQEEMLRMRNEILNLG